MEICILAFTNDDTSISSCYFDALWPIICHYGCTEIAVSSSCVFVSPSTFSTILAFFAERLLTIDRPTVCRRSRTIVSAQRIARFPMVTINRPRQCRRHSIQIEAVRLLDLPMWKLCRSHCQIYCCQYPGYVVQDLSRYLCCPQTVESVQLWSMMDCSSCWQRIPVRKNETISQCSKSLCGKRVFFLVHSTTIRGDTYNHIKSCNVSTVYTHIKTATISCVDAIYPR